MSERNPDPNPEVFELATTLKPDGVPDTIVLNQAPLPEFHAPAASMPATVSKGAYHIWTIGCQMNVADSNHVAAELERIGYRPTEAMDDADIVVLNTCVVRQSAEDKGIGKASNLKPWKRARSNRTLALMGCMVGVKPSPQLQDRFPHVDVFMPPSEP